MAKLQTQRNYQWMIVDPIPLSKKWGKKGAMTGLLAGAGITTLSPDPTKNLAKSGLFVLSLGLLGGAVGFFSGKVMQKYYPTISIAEKKIKKIS